MNIKELTTGQTFTADFTQGTEYVVDSAVTTDNQTIVEYHIPNEYGRPYRGRTVKPSLTTVFVKD